ncbi:hypothetical protein IU449_11415 [Nocardia higoensis]|uniref:Uncharacterized protein n=1 Tax=Nocardia higoensis TaxID=228599 RepID=A0ABS0D9L7_9NOCA|nr:hypothetical protein [Nocardia higoensis]MBF6355141.1 hypothetical protein [Nocardia higoensis]
MTGTDPRRAQELAWEWIRELGDADDRAALAELFGHGVAEAPRTRTEGIPVGRMRHIPLEGIANAILAANCPWTGKTFHPGGGGYNRVKWWAAPAVAVLNPRWMRREGGQVTSFPFDTAVARGVVEPHVDVVAITYNRPEYHNPSGVALLADVIDELVQIVPGVYLGRATVPGPSGGHVLSGYFALRPELGGR